MPCLPELIVEATNNPGYSEDALMAVGPAALHALTNSLQTTPFPEKGRFVNAFTKALDWRIKRDEAAVALPFLIAIVNSTNRDVSAVEAWGSFIGSRNFVYPSGGRIIRLKSGVS